MNIIETLPWPPILLGLAAALSILVIYDLAYVYPLSRRWSAVAERCRLLEQMFCDLPSLTAQVELLANRGRSDLTQIGDRLGQLELATESHSYEQAITGAARGQEIAETLGVPLDEYHRMVESAASARVLSYEQLADDPERAGLLPDTPEDGPETLLEGDQFREALARAVSSLPDRERLVLSLYYDEELNLREIGEVLEVSESRVCQIHGQAVLRVRARLAEWFSDENESR